MKDVHAELAAMRDDGNGDFLSRLMPGIGRERILGIRMPALRRYAAHLALDKASSEAFMASLPHPTVDGTTFEDWFPCAGVRLKTGIVKNIGKFGMIWNAGSTSWQWCGTTAANVKIASAGSNTQPHTAALSVRCRKM